MADIKKALSSRRGYRAHLTKLLQSVDELLRSVEKPLTDDVTITLRDMHEQLQRKEGLISALDAKILDALDNDEEIESEVLQAEDTASLIATAKAKITHHLTPPATPPSSRLRSTEPRDSSNTATHLPKLDLPQFSGNPLYWQPFWDSFEAAVDANTSLTGVQKLSYLRAQLHGEASDVIAGFQLTNTSYNDSVQLLKERFGEPYIQIEAHMQALVELPNPSNTSSSIREFYDNIERHIRSLTALGQTEETYGSLLTTILLGKLPLKMKQNMARAHGKREWTITELRTSIRDEIHILEIGSQTEPPTVVSPTAAFHSGVIKSKGKIQCPFCKGAHSALACERIQDPRQRTNIVRQERLCFNCLGHHKISDCNSKHRCHHCRRKHHTSLCTHEQQTDSNTPAHSGTVTNPTQQQHGINSQPRQHSVSHQQHGNNSQSRQQTTGASQPQSTPPTVSNHLQSNDTSSLSVTLPLQQSSVCFLKTAIGTVACGRRTVEAKILLDEGSQRSFVTQELANSLALQPYTQERINISSFGTTNPTSRTLDAATINLLTRSGETVQLSVLIVPFIAAPLQNTCSVTVTNLPHLHNLQLAHPITADREFKISLLIGADQYWDIVGDHVVRGNGPTAVASKLGYLLSGPMQPTPHSSEASVLMVTNSSQFEFDLQRFWDLESVGVSLTDETAKDNILKHYLTSCLTRDDDGAYVARFPWKSTHPVLPTNITVAERRTRHLIKQLAKNPKQFQVYNQILTEQETRGFIERVDVSRDHSSTHYIPHHPVEKNSTTTPIRIVFDCSCRQGSNYPSLNDCLMTGFPCSNDLCAILVRFRLRQFGISTDIEKAFLHVRLHPEDRDFTRFLWLTDQTNPSSKLCTYRFRVVPFGATSSPFMLNAVLQHHLKQHNSAISQDMRANLYVDNIITSCDTEQKAVEYYKEARSIMSSANFNLRSWSSNSTKLKAIAAQENTADDSVPISILGLCWNPNTDKISLATKSSILTNEDLITKREILQDLSKVFDPLGFIAPIVIRGKILMQKLWQLKVTWDEPLNDNIHAEWKNAATDVKKATQFSVSRCYFNTHVSHPSIHCFVDASQQAYGAIVFLVQGNQTSFVISKTRVAPLKALTIPRLELMAALVGTRLTHFVLESITTCDLPTFMWSDSQIVLNWISSQKPLPAFVSHRITEVKSLLPNSTWNYCPTSDNPADLLSRGTTADVLLSSALWQHGPKWLPNPDKWPSSELPPMSPLALAAAVATEFVPPEPALPDTGLHLVICIDRHSTLRKLLAVTAHVIRFTDNLIVPLDQRRTGPISADEYVTARRWLRDTQQSVYSKEINNLQQLANHPNTPRRMLVRQLRLFIDAKGFLRCGGRIHNAPLKDLTKFPYLIPAKHPFSRLIIWDIHVNLYHAGTSATLTALRQTYWIPSARQYIKSVLRTCVVCRRVSGKPYPTPDTAPLPYIRTQDVYPFTYTGVDFTGALYVRQGRNEVKVYLCLFTCATTRAVHLEIVQDLTSESFLLTFRKFVGRRSLPRIMISDNGSTYLSAATELQSLMKLPEVKEELSRRGVTWKFIPKRAPWYGGFWERLVGLTKSAIKKVLGRRHISLTVLETIVVEIEAVINDRPLTFVSSELGDVEPLTPAHLLHGRRITYLPHEMVDTDEILDPSYGDTDSVHRRAKSLALILRDFRNRWRHDYLTSLREFHRTSGSVHQVIKKGDVVIIHDDVPRIMWKIAVVSDLVVGGDGVVRAAILRTANGTTNRPITKLYPLELNETESLTDLTTQEEHRMVTPATNPESSVDIRPQRQSARNASARMKEWARVLFAPPEDVMETEQ